ncbi:MAG: hypothetical protein ACR2PW_05745 [Gammaproteobacteria bacterium]
MLLETLAGLSFTTLLLVIIMAWPMSFARPWKLMNDRIGQGAAIQILEALLKHEVQHAGFYGCGTSISAPPPLLVPGLAIYPQTTTGLPSWQTEALNRASPGTPVLLVQYLNPEQQWYASPTHIQWLSDTQLELALAHPLDALEVNQTVILSDCDRHLNLNIQSVQLGATWFTLTASAPVAMDTQQAFTAANFSTTPVLIALPVQRMFYLARSSLTDEAGSKLSHLYVKDYDRSASAIMDGIEAWELSLQTSPSSAFQLLNIRAALKTYTGGSETVDYVAAAYHL